MEYNGQSALLTKERGENFATPRRKGERSTSPMEKGGKEKWWFFLFSGGADCRVALLGVGPFGLSALSGVLLGLLFIFGVLLSCRLFLVIQVHVYEQCSSLDVLFTERIQAPLKRNSKRKDPSTIRRNSQGKDPSSFERSSKGQGKCSSERIFGCPE